MILQALYEYYNRKASDPSNFIAPEGWEWKEIPYRIIINRKGEFITIEDTREGEGRNKRAKKFLVPQSVKRTVGNKANLLWDNLEYALGANPRNRDDVDDRFNLFKERIKSEIDVENIPSVKSLTIFLENEPIKQIEHILNAEQWKKILEENPFVVFKVDKDTHSCICDDIRDKIKQNEDKAADGICLITGKRDKIARLHPTIKGVRGGNTQGGALVSYNLSPFNSYGKKQNFNSSVSEKAAFAYTTALNILLGKDSPNKITIVDSTIVFWSEKQPTEINPEEIFPWVIAMQKAEKDDPDAGVNKIKKLFEAIQTGQLSSERTNHFYVLGLAPNAARISVRFWKTPSVEDFGKNIKQHFEDFDIIHKDNESKYISLYEILSSVSIETKKRDKANIIFYKGKAYDVLPQLAGQVVEAVLDNYLYPQSLLQQCLLRIRAEASKKNKDGKLIPNITRSRAAIIKACLNRKIRIQKLNQKEITMSLDPNNTNVAYRTGRLFATLEKIQEEANPGINATIRDRYYGAASSSPITVFPRLLSLKNSHLKKLPEGRKIYFEKLITDIFCEIKSFPANLSLNEQANFAIGYYHQRQDFFTKKSDNEKNENETNNN